MLRFSLLVAVLAAASRLHFPCETSFAYAAEQVYVPGEEVRAVAGLLERESLSRQRLDDHLSAKWLRAFLDRLDPKQMYFLQADDAEFRQFQSRLGDLAKAGDFEFPRQVRHRYAKRVAEAASYADQAISVRHDYSIDEELPVRFDSYAADARDLRERWRLRIKFELLVEKAHGVSMKDAEAQLRGRYARIARQAREMTDERLRGIYLNSLAACYDPHSGYWGPTELASFTGGLIRPYTLGLGFRQVRGEFVIVSVHPSLSDLMTDHDLIGWHVLAIRRTDGTTYDAVEADPMEFFDLIRWKLERDTKVILELMDPVTYARMSISWRRFVGR